MASSLRPHKFPFEAYSSKFFAIFNFFSANSNPIANNFYYKGSAKKIRDIFAISFACTWPGPKYPILVVVESGTETRIGYLGPGHVQAKEIAKISLIFFALPL